MFARTTAAALIALLSVPALAQEGAKPAAEEAKPKRRK